MSHHRTSCKHKESIKAIFSIFYIHPPPNTGHQVNKSFFSSSIAAASDCILSIVSMQCMDYGTICSLMQKMSPSPPLKEGQPNCSCFLKYDTWEHKHVLSHYRNCCMQKGSIRPHILNYVHKWTGINNARMHHAVFQNTLMSSSANTWLTVDFPLLQVLYQLHNQKSSCPMDYGTTDLCKMVPMEDLRNQKIVTAERLRSENWYFFKQCLETIQQLSNICRFVCCSSKVEPEQNMLLMLVASSE